MEYRWKENTSDDNGNVIKQIGKDANGNIVFETEYTYENGKRINATKTEYDGSNVTKKVAYAYQANGKIAKTVTIDYIQGLTKTNIYNEQGNVTYKEIKAAN